MSGAGPLTCVYCRAVMPPCGEEKYRQHLQDWHNVTVSEELERAVAVAKDRVGEEQGGRTPAKLSKENWRRGGG